MPRFVTDSNLQAVGRAATTKALHKLERKLLRAGIKTDIMKSRVVRLDLFANVKTDEPFEHYLPLFRGLHVSRATRVEYQTTGFEWRNAEQEIAIYDKRAEMQHRRESVVDLPPNIIRFEHRLKKARKVLETLEIVTVRNLLDDYDRIRAYFKQTIRRNLFAHDVKGLNRSAGSQIESALLAFMEGDNRYWRSDFLAALGARDIIRRIGRSGLKKLLAKHVGASDAWRFDHKVSEWEATLRLLRPAKGSRKRLGDLQEELKRKLFGEEDRKIEL